MKGKVRCVSNVDCFGLESKYITKGKEYECKFFSDDRFTFIDDDGDEIDENLIDMEHGKFELARDVIYIAGPMTGLPNYNREAFFKKAMELRRQGYVVLTPSVLPAGLSDIAYMDICLAMVRSSEAIYMLSGWDSSAGAVAEHALASKLALTIIYE